MKNYAHAILQFTGYPLEPIVALTIQKSYPLQSPYTADTTSVIVAPSGNGAPAMHATTHRLLH